MTTPILHPTSERVKGLMERHGWTQHEVADYLGVPRGTLGNWMQGTRDPMPVVARLLDVLGTIEMMSPSIHATLVSKKKEGK